MAQSVLIDGKWRAAQAPAGSFRALDPRTGEPRGEEYPVSGLEDIIPALEAGRRAAQSMRTIEPDRLAAFLEAYAGLIEANDAELAAAASQETALPVSPRLRDTELPRTTGQLRQAAAAARDRSWCMAAIDTALNIRSRYASLDGPVVVLGPNNFPFAFNPVSGGDFAAALAAGNPVLAKAHPGHPETTRLLAELALAALRRTGLPQSLVQLIYDVRGEDGFKLVAHPDLGAASFTGSRASGLRLKQEADRVGKPIYLEMSGINPVILLPGALEERGAEIAAELARSCTLGVGQFCTNPGLVILQQGPEAELFLSETGGQMERLPEGDMLGPQVLEGWSAALKVLKAHGAEEVTRRTASDISATTAANTLYMVSGEAFLKNSGALQTEAFGPSTLAVLARDEEQMCAIASALEGSLTGTLYSHSGDRDESLYERLEPLLRARVGRLLNDKMPTGVAVTPAMHHGGPFPATGHPGFTSIGIPRAMLRFSALHCYDNVRPHRLPPELRDENPTGKMWRCIDGSWTQADVTK